MTAVDDRPTAKPTAPGVYPDLDQEAYHRDPALSASGAKRLLSPGCPALFKHDRDNGGRPPKRTFDFGHAAHAAVLGSGPELVIIDADDYRTKAAQQQQQEAYAVGKVPVLPKEKAVVDAMAAALRAHPIASELLDPSTGRAEVSLFWNDEQRGIARRARFDWLRNSSPDGHLIVPDYKTTSSAEPHAFSRSIFNFGYDIQAVFYTDAAIATGLARDVTFRLIAQETTEPYLVTIHELDYMSLRLGRARVDEACNVFRTCTATGNWPGYSTDVEYVGPPKWLAAEYGLDLDLVI